MKNLNSATDNIFMLFSSRFPMTFLATILIKLIMAVLFRLIRFKKENQNVKNIIFILVIHLLTQTLFYLSITAFSIDGYILSEIIMIMIEAFLYYQCFKPITIHKTIFYSVTVNILSLFCMIIVLFI